MIVLVSGPNNSGKKSFITKIVTGEFNNSLEKGEKDGNYFYIEGTDTETPDIILVFADSTDIKSLNTAKDVVNEYARSGLPVFFIMNKKDVNNRFIRVKTRAESTFFISVKNGYGCEDLVYDINERLKPAEEVVDFTGHLDYLNEVLKQSIDKMHLNPVLLRIITEYPDINTSEIEGMCDDPSFDEKKISWRTVVLPKKSLGIRNEISSRERDHLAITSEEFVWQKHCPRGISLYDITEAVFRMAPDKNIASEKFNELKIEKDDDSEYSFIVTFS